MHANACNSDLMQQPVLHLNRSALSILALQYGRTLELVIARVLQSSALM